MKKQALSRPPIFSYLLGSANIAGKKILDLFAGGGGVSLGVELAGRAERLQPCSSAL